MAILPAGFALPPLPYLVGLLVGLAGVGYGFRERRPAVGEREVLALAPWMVVGSVLHVLYVLDALPALLRPLAGTPAVYASVAVLAGGLWLGLDAARVAGGAPTPARGLAAAGSVALLVAVAAALAVGLGRGSLALVWPAVGLALAAVLGGGAWLALTSLVPAVGVTGRVGLLAVLGHALDGVSTAVGVDVLGFGERTPLSRLVIEFAASLPTAEVVGAGWLFVLVKLVVAGVVVAAMTDYVREEPAEGYLLLGLVAAVGLGPGAHNLVLFAVA